jgi:hypothetical protein
MISGHSWQSQSKRSHTGQGWISPLLMAVASAATASPNWLTGCVAVAGAGMRVRRAAV